MKKESAGNDVICSLIFWPIMKGLKIASTKEERVYFSLGDKESRTKHPVMRIVEDNTRKLCDAYAAQGIETTFELNPGNHFQDAELRLAKGVAWILEGAQT